MCVLGPVASHFLSVLWRTEEQSPAERTHTHTHTHTHTQTDTHTHSLTHRHTLSDTSRLCPGAVGRSLVPSLPALSLGRGRKEKPPGHSVMLATAHHTPHLKTDTHTQTHTHRHTHTHRSPGRDLMRSCRLCVCVVVVSHSLSLKLLRFRS